MLKADRADTNGDAFGWRFQDAQVTWRPCWEAQANDRPQAAGPPGEGLHGRGHQCLRATGNAK